MIEYNDRGRLKWSGFHLLDHTERISADDAQCVSHNLAKEQITTEEIAKISRTTVIKSRPVRIRKKERNAGGYYPDDVVGKTIGYDELGVFVEEEKVCYDEIRNVSFTEPLKWSQIWTLPKNTNSVILRTNN